MLACNGLIDDTSKPVGGFWNSDSTSGGSWNSDSTGAVSGRESSDDGDFGAAGKSGWYEQKPKSVFGRPIRVICLHGTSSCPDMMKMQLQALEKECKGCVEFIYLKGKVKLSEADACRPEVAKMRQVLKNEDLTSWVRYATTTPLDAGGVLDYDGLEEAADDLEEEMQKHAPIDGVVAFSQGSNVASLLAGRAVTGKGTPLAFIVHMSSSMPTWAGRYPEYFATSLRIPSFHVWGQTDSTIQSNRPEQMAGLYTAPEIVQHSGDHRPLPKEKAEADCLAKKILDFMERAIEA